MAKKFIPLGLDPLYCDNESWGKAQGVREFLQNGRDAEVAYGAPLTVKHDPVNRVLTISNVGASIPRSSIRLGATTKRGDSRLIGVHGEGSKVGSLALVRAECKVTINTSLEVWEPAIENCELYGGEPTFGFLVSPARSSKSDKVVVTISNISAEEWEQWRGNYLWLPGAPKVHRIATEIGDLLTDKEKAGRIYVKGIFVQEKVGYTYGYDFHQISLDRDRQVVDSYDLSRAVTKVFSAAGMADEGMLRAVYDLFANNTGEIASLDAYSAQDGMGKETLQKLKAHFTEMHGADAEPVVSDDERADALAIGRRPVTVSEPLGRVLSLVGGSVKDQRRSLAKEIRHSYPQDELTAEEQQALASLGQWMAIGDVKVATWTWEVVDFKMTDVLVLVSGTREPVPWVRVSKDALSDGPKLIAATTMALHNARTVRENFVSEILQAACAMEATLPPGGE